MGGPVPEIPGGRTEEATKTLSTITTSGLVIACIVSGLGLFISAGLSSPLLFPWVIGYLFLALRVNYDAYVNSAPLKPFPFIVLGIVLLVLIALQLGLGVLLVVAGLPLAAALAHNLLAALLLASLLALP